jgi:hypothetical protein
MSIISQFRDDAIRIIVNQPCTIMNSARVYDENGEAISFDESLVEAEEIKLRAEYESKQYQRDRQPEYPSIPDQLDKIYHSGINEWKKDIKAVKDKYPKP